MSYVAFDIIKKRFGDRRSYRIIKHLIKKAICFSRGIYKAGINVYVSPRSGIVGSHRIGLGDNVVIERDAFLCADGDNSSIEIGADSYLSCHCMLKTSGGWIKIGKSCTVNSFAVLYGQGGLEIGDGVRIAAHAVIVPMDHVFENPDVPIWTQGESKKGIKIENDVWIGVGVKVLDGVIIGKGSVIGAGAVVTKDIPPFSVAVGVPARVIRKRL